MVDCLQIIVSIVFVVLITSPLSIFIRKHTNLTFSTIVCLNMYNTLFNYDTTLFADSVEVIPNSYDGLAPWSTSSLGFFVSGTYQLDEATRKRDGCVVLHQLEVHSDFPLLKV